MRNGVKLIPVAVPALTRDPLAIVQHYRRALQAADCTVRGVLFCNPHNPRGQIYPSDIIEALLCFCEENNLHFVSDEIYALSTFGSGWAPCESSRIHKAQTTSFTSVLQMRLDTLGVNASRVHTLYSISKDLGSSGLRLVLAPFRGIAHDRKLKPRDTGLSRHPSESRTPHVARHTEQCQGLDRHGADGDANILTDLGT